MRLKIRATWIVILGIGFLAAQASAGEQAALKTPKEMDSYSIGVGVAKNIQAQQVDVDLDVLIKGLKDGLAGGKLLMTEEELRVTMKRMQAQTKAKQDQTQKIAGLRNKKEGEVFLEENKKKDGVVTLPSGLQYKVIKAGGGKKPTEADTVECRYRGTLLNGTEFDSSERSGQPSVTFLVKGLLPGIREALKLMPAGSKWQLFIPPELAYGDKGSGQDIGPNATLIFEIELMAVK